MGGILSRSAVLGISKETANGTWLTPTYGVPFQKASWKDVIAPSRDESVRGNDSMVQGQYQGPIDADWDITMSAYPDLLGFLLRGIIGPDTVTAGTAGTLTSATTAGAAASLPTSVSYAANTVLMLDTAGLVEYVLTGTTASTGTTGAYTTPLASGTVLQYAHASGAVVTSQAQHVFKQSPTTALPSYSLTVFDGLETLGYSYGRFTDMQVKIDPKSAVTIESKLLTLPWSSQSVVTETFTSAAPFQGWSWTTTQAGTASTRGLTYDVTLKRAGEAIHTSMGQQAARENFVGVLECDGSYKAMFDTLTDLNIYQNNTQQPFTVGLKTPLALGGAALTLTMSQAGWSAGVRDYGSNYIAATFSLTGIQNTTDGGIVSATLNNWVQTAY